MPNNQIVRVVKNRDHPFVMVSRAVTEDIALSWEARGVLCYLLGKPDNWQVKVVNLVNMGPGSRERMMRILSELESRGYMQRRKYHDANGHWVWESVIYEVPPESGFPLTVNPTTVQPTTEKPTIYKGTNGTSNDRNDNERGTLPASLLPGPTPDTAGQSLPSADDIARMRPEERLAHVEAMQERQRRWGKLPH